MINHDDVTFNIIKLHKEVFEEFYSTKELIEENGHPFKALLPEGSKIVDVGCGSGGKVLDLVQKNYFITAIDMDLSELKRLEQRLVELDKSSLVEFLHIDFEKEVIDFRPFQGIIFSDILHFFSWNWLIERFSEFHNSINSGTVIAVRVHKKDCPFDKKNKKKYFKHFFTFQDLEILFPLEYFSVCLKSTCEYSMPPKQIKMSKEWRRRVAHEIYKIDDVQIIEKDQNRYLIDNCWFESLDYIVIRK